VGPPDCKDMDGLEGPPQPTMHPAGIAERGKEGLGLGLRERCASVILLPPSKLKPDPLA